MTIDGARLRAQVCDMPMTAQNKYYGSGWRRDAGRCPGGFMMESSVHFLAALRMLARAGGAAPPQFVTLLHSDAVPTFLCSVRWLHTDYKMETYNSVCCREEGMRGHVRLMTAAGPIVIKSCAKSAI